MAGLPSPEMGMGGWENVGATPTRMMVPAIVRFGPAEAAQDASFLFVPDSSRDPINGTELTKGLFIIDPFDRGRDKAGNVLSGYFSANKREITIGRDGKSDIVLQDPRSSRNHARISIDPVNGCQLQDTNSSNGTFQQAIPEYTIAGSEMTIAMGSWGSINLSQAGNATLVLGSVNGTLIAQDGKMFVTITGTKQELESGKPILLNNTTIVRVGERVLVRNNSASSPTVIRKDIPAVTGAERKVANHAFGAHSIGGRGKEFSNNPGGQDRYFADTLRNSVRVFMVNDGAGPKGHDVAETVKTQINGALSNLTPEQINEQNLLSIANQIQDSIPSEFGGVSGSTADAVICLPDGRRIIFHVGESNMAQLSGKETIIMPLFSPHRPEAGTDGFGFKAHVFGSVLITPEARVIAENIGPIGLMSDGFWDAYEYAQGNSQLIPTDYYDKINSFINDKNYDGAAQYMATTARDWWSQAETAYNAIHNTAVNKQKNNQPLTDLEKKYLGKFSGIDDITVMIVD